MDLFKLSRISDGKRNHIPSENARQDAKKKLFENVKETTKLENRISDSVISKKLVSQRDLISKLKDDLDTANSKITELKKSLEQKAEEQPSVEEFFKAKLDEKESVIKTLTESLQELQSEKKPVFEYDIVTEIFKVGNFSQQVEPEIAKVLAEILTNVPETNVSTNIQVKDALDSTQSTEFKSFIDAVEKAMDGDLKPLSEYDISVLPKDLLPFAKAVKEGNPYISKEEYSEFAPVVKSYLLSEKLKFPSLPLIADAKSV